MLVSIGSVAVLGLSALVADTYEGSSRSHLHGTSIFHWTVYKVMTDPSGAVSPSSSVLVSHKTQGHADKQSLRIVARGLDPDTEYHLVALITNKPGLFAVDGESGYVGVAKFTPRPNGTVVLRSMKISSSRGLKTVAERFKLPTELDPVQDILKLVIAEGDDTAALTAVLTADLTQPGRWQFLFRRELSHPDEGDPAFAEKAEGVLHLRGHQNRAWFRLNLAGLEGLETDPPTDPPTDPAKDYYVVMIDREGVKTAELLPFDGLRDPDGCLNTLTPLDAPEGAPGLRPADLPGLRRLEIRQFPAGFSGDPTSPDTPGELVLETDLLDP